MMMLSFTIVVFEKVVVKKYATQQAIIQGIAPKILVKAT